MQNEVKKYYLAHFGNFAPLDDKEFNDLCSLDLTLTDLPCVLYLKKGHMYRGKEKMISERKLKTILKKTTELIIN